MKRDDGSTSANDATITGATQTSRDPRAMPASDPQLASQRRLRLAVFSPVPPTPSGIAVYLADLLPLLPDTWSIDVFGGDDAEHDPDRLSLLRGALVGCYPYPDFESRHARAPYDLTIYQVGNSSERAWMFDYALNFPGLLVLHDGVLHPARYAAAAAERDLHGYRRMARACRPDVGDAIGQLVAAGLGGPALFFTFPMCEDLVRASRVTAVHGAACRDWLRRLVPEARVVSLAHWRSVAVDRAVRDRWRHRLAPDDEVVIGAFGHVGGERRLDRVLQALAAIEARTPWRLVVAGRVDARLALADLAERLGIGDRVVWHDDLEDDDFVAVMAATDCAVNLRYPPARASSGVLHQLLHLGVPALISDVVHWRDYPDDAVARIPAGPDAAEAAALRTTLQHWIEDPVARRAAGAAARAWATRHITRHAMRSSYVEAVEACL